MLIGSPKWPPQLTPFPTCDKNTFDLIFTSLPGQFQDIHSPDKLSDHDIVSGFLRIFILYIMEYGSCVWYPQGMVLQQEIKKIQVRAARFVTSNYSFETGSMTGILENLIWESLKKRRRDSRLILLYKGLKGAACIPTDDLIPPN